LRCNMRFFHAINFSLFESPTCLFPIQCKIWLLKIKWN
jgi:hypothetical protein